jgi:cell division protein FtsB
MAVTAPVSSPSTLPAEKAPSPRHGSGGRPRLDVVDRRQPAASRERRQATVLKALGAMFVVGALAVTAAAHTFVASDQQRIDALQSQLSSTLATQQDLQLSRAQLESPSRVLAIAEHQLGMVSPGSVSYLAPVDPGPSVEQAGTSAASAARAASTPGRAGRAMSGGPAGGAVHHGAGRATHSPAASRPTASRAG